MSSPRVRRARKHLRNAAPVTVVAPAPAVKAPAAPVKKAAPKKKRASRATKSN